MIIILEQLLIVLAAAFAAVSAQEVPIDSPIPGSFGTPFQLYLKNGSTYRCKA
jgi:hypothetical protein